MFTLRIIELTETCKQRDITLETMSYVGLCAKLLVKTYKNNQKNVCLYFDTTWEKVLDKINMHKFELCGLGIAPFKCVSIVTAELNGCDYCGRPIRVHCIIQDKNGKKFKVGSGCVKKNRRPRFS